jgi:hypothetical protein
MEVLVRHAPVLSHTGFGGAVRSWDAPHGPSHRERGPSRAAARAVPSPWPSAPSGGICKGGSGEREEDAVKPNVWVRVGAAVSTLGLLALVAFGAVLWRASTRAAEHTALARAAVTRAAVTHAAFTPGAAGSDALPTAARMRARPSAPRTSPEARLARAGLRLLLPGEAAALQGLEVLGDLRCAARRALRGASAPRPACPRPAPGTGAALPLC